MAIPGASFPGGMPGEPSYPSAPYARSGKSQPRSPRGPKKTITVKRHTRTVSKPPKNHPPKGPQAPLPPSDQALIDAAVRSRFAPEEQGLRNQLTQNAMYSAGLNDWYKQATDQIRALQSGANANVQGTIGQVQAYASQPTLPGNAQDAQAATARNNLNAAFAAQIAANATSNSGALDRFMAAMAVQQANQAGEAQLQRMGLYGQQGQLGRQKADFGLTYGSQLAQSQQKALTDRQKLELAAKALNIKLDTLNNVQKPLAKSLIKDRGTKAKQGRSKIRETKQQHAIQNALDVNDLALKAYKLAHPNAGKKGAGSNSTYSKSKVQGFRANWDYAQATAKQLRDKKTYTDKQGRQKPVTQDVAYSALLAATKDPDIAKAAALAAFGQPIPADLRHRLAIKGVHPPKVKKQQTIGGVVQNVLQNLEK